MSKALIIVDVQNDFCEGGSLAVEGGRALGVRIAEKLTDGSFTRLFDHIVTTQDWHVKPEGHFSETPDYKDTWPVHCLASETGSDFTPELAEALKKVHHTEIHKGQYTAAYSGFDGATPDGLALETRLRDLNVTDVVVVGIATEHCVFATARDAAGEGFATTVWSDYCVGIDDVRINEVLENELPTRGVRVI